jgi:hypothetical protein
VFWHVSERQLLVQNSANETKEKTAEISTRRKTAAPPPPLFHKFSKGGG